MRKRGLRIPRTGLRIPCQWNLDSGLQSSAVSWIPTDEFRILKPRISYSGIQITLLGARQFLSSIIIHEQKANEFTTPNPTELFFTYHEEISVVGKV